MNIIHSIATFIDELKHISISQWDVEHNDILDSKSKNNQADELKSMNMNSPRANNVPSL